MLRINNYVKVNSLEEAYELNQKRNNVIIGGMLWLKMQNHTIGTAIDMSDLGLSNIEENEDSYIIGAMVSLRQLEQHEGLNAITNGSIADSVKQIVGVQFRNMATVGGSIFGRYGFSDVLTIFMALNAEVELFNKGIVPIEEFTEMDYDNDILVRIIVKKQKMKVAYLSQRNTKTDFPVLTCAISEINGIYRCVIGARPIKAVCVYDKENILSKGINEESAKEFGKYVSENIVVGGNLRASKEYRQLLTGVLIKRGLLKINELGGISDAN